MKKLILGARIGSSINDILFENDVITKIENKIDSSQSRVNKIIEANGAMIIPKFIDVHAHDDIAIFQPNLIKHKINQGFGSVINGNCGISISPTPKFNPPPPPFDILGDSNNFKFPNFRSYIDKIKSYNLPINAFTLIGHSSLRLTVMPFEDVFSRAATSDEIKKMKTLLEDAFALGAIGFSTGLAYPTNIFASNEEVIALAEIAGKHNKIFTAHIRNEYEQVFDSLKEIIQIAKTAKAKLHVSHVKLAGPSNHGRIKELFEILNSHDLTFDAYPFTAGSTIINENSIINSEKVIITWSKSHPEMSGKELSIIAKEWNCTELQAAEKLKPGGAMYYHMQENDVLQIIAHPNCMIGTDGLPHDECPHPRLFTTIPTLFEHVKNKKNFINIDEAIYKLTKQAIVRFNLNLDYEIKEGFKGDFNLINI